MMHYTTLWCITQHMMHPHHMLCMHYTTYDASRIFFGILMGVLQRDGSWVCPREIFVYITMSPAGDPRPYSSGPQGWTGDSDKVNPWDLIVSKWRDVACHKLLSRLISALPQTYAVALFSTIILLYTVRDNYPSITWINYTLKYKNRAFQGKLTDSPFLSFSWILVNLSEANNPLFWGIFLLCWKTDV